MKKILVKSIIKSYPVYIGNNTFSLLPDLIEKYNLPRRIFVIVDRNVNLFFQKEIKQILKSISDKINFIVLTASEKNKSLNSASKIFSVLHKENYGRDTLLIVIGGGTIGDLAGFVASTYMRGVSLVHIPTTLLSMVDSSIGGKTGVNFRAAKNFIGTFYPPAFVVCDTSFLKTLPQAEINSGLGEVVKYSYLMDVEFYGDLLSNIQHLYKKNLKLLNEVIWQCIKIKSAVVSEDEFEKSGLRKILNFGHTFAHAYESMSEYKIPHGKAVIIGILNALYLSDEMGLINQIQMDKMVELPLKFKEELKIDDFNENVIYTLLNYDKKNKAGEIKFVLLRNFGEILVDVSADRKSVLKAIKETKKILV